jgi:DNA repair protein RadC
VSIGFSKDQIRLFRWKFLVAAIKAIASAVILLPCRPSGQLKPNEVDIKLTKKLIDGGKFLEISVLDHIIVSSESYYSFADKGLL